MSVVPVYDDERYGWTDVLSDVLHALSRFVFMSVAFMVGTIVAIVGMWRAGLVIQGGPAEVVNRTPVECADFDDRREAQAVFEVFGTDRFGLDMDGDGNACEGIPE